MITEDYVSFETAKLLKEKGFDTVDIDAYFPFVYYSDGKMDFYDDDNPLFVCEAVTLQMAMKWLREVHNIALNVCYLLGTWAYIIYRTDVSTSRFNSEDFDTYEEACEAGIKHCLENLI